MLAFLVLACTTYTFDVPQEINTEKNLNVVFSQAGFVRYAELNVIKVFRDYLNKPLGNLSFDLAGFSFYLTNLVLTELENPDISLILLEDTDQADVTLRDFGIKLNFEFHLMHMTFPYMEDAGTGRLFFELDNIHVLTQVHQSENCPGALHINATHASAKIEDIRIIFDSYLSYIYDAILPFVTSFLRDYLNDELSDTIIDELLAAGNKFLENFAPIGHYYTNSTLCSDQRWVGNVQIVDRQFIASVSGAGCIFNSIFENCSGKPAYQAPPRCEFMINTDITYELSTNLFNYRLEYMWLLNRSYIFETFGLTHLTLKARRVVKTGVVVEIVYEKNGVFNTIYALAKIIPDYLPWYDSIVIVAYFDLHITFVTDPGSVSLDEATQLALGLNSIIREYGYTVVNGYDMDLKHAQVVYCDENWIFVGVKLYDYDS